MYYRAPHVVGYTRSYARLICSPYTESRKRLNPTPPSPQVVIATRPDVDVGADSVPRLRVGGMRGVRRAHPALRAHPTTPPKARKSRGSVTARTASATSC